MEWPTIPETEKQILEWAEAHGYEIKPRLWRNQVSEARENGIRLRDTHLNGIDSDWEAYQRGILVPKGLVTYSLFEFHWNTFYQIFSEKDIPAFFERDGNHENYIEWFLGKRLQNWRSDEAPGNARSDRKNQASEGGLLVVSGCCSRLYGLDGAEIYSGGIAKKEAEEEQTRKLLGMLEARIEAA